MRTEKLLAGLVISLALLSTFCFGVAIKEPLVITEYQPYEVQVIKEVIKEVEIIKEVEVEKTVELREFASLEELEAWLDEDITDAIHLISPKSPEDGCAYVDPDYDCDNYACDLRKAAEQDGFQISIQIDTHKNHALNSTIINNEIYFIEPQTDEVWLWGHRN